MGRETWPCGCFDWSSFCSMRRWIAQWEGDLAVTRRLTDPGHDSASTISSNSSAKRSSSWSVSCNGHPGKNILNIATGDEEYVYILAYTILYVYIYLIQIDIYYRRQNIGGISSNKTGKCGESFPQKPWFCRGFIPSGELTWQLNIAIYSGFSL